MRPKFIIGIDEVGRGPLAGPLCIGACAARAAQAPRWKKTLRGIKDCKQLSPAQREQWLTVLQREKQTGNFRSATAFVGNRIIDKRGMAYALRLGICRTLRKLGLKPDTCRVLLDGSLKAPRHYTNQQTIIGGDEREPLIALASIAAKCRRDRHMERRAQEFPQYDFDIHKGYGTKRHYTVLRTHGPSPIHRMSFLPK